MRPSFKKPLFKGTSDGTAISSAVTSYCITFNERVGCYQEPDPQEARLQRTAKRVLSVIPLAWRVGPLLLDAESTLSLGPDHPSRM
jgi:hypothetical protein